MTYVLYRDDKHNRETYLMGVIDAKVVPTLLLDEARRFPSASDAYRYGATHAPKLNMWRAGRR